MCAVSYVSYYGQTIMPPVYSWDTNQALQWQKLLEAAKIFDKETGQPDCVDLEKAKFEKLVLDRLEAIEKKLEKDNGF